MSVAHHCLLVCALIGYAAAAAFAYTAVKTATDVSGFSLALSPTTATLGRGATLTTAFTLASSFAGQYPRQLTTIWNATNAGQVYYSSFTPHANCLLQWPLLKDAGCTQDSTDAYTWSCPAAAYSVPVTLVPTVGGGWQAGDYQGEITVGVGHVNLEEDDLCTWQDMSVLFLASFSFTIQ